MSTPEVFSGRAGMIQRVARDLKSGSYVNLGVGIPVDVLPLLRHRPDVFVHSENGVLGMRALDPDETTDDDMVNAGKMPVGLHDGASFFHHADSFAMMRGGHLDVCVLGAYQVSATGDLANGPYPRFMDTGCDYAAGCSVTVELVSKVSGEV